MTIDTQEALASGRELVLKHKLPLKIIKGASDEGGLRFYYLSPEKTDLRPLSRDLNRRFKIKINLEELTAEEAAKIIPGYSPCGTRLCWASDACENLWPCQFKEAEPTTKENIQKEESAEISTPEISENQRQGVGESTLIGENQLKISDHPRARKKLVRRLVLK